MTMNALKSIKFKFTLWYLAVLAIVLISLGCGVYLSLSHQLRGNLDRSLMNRAQQVSEFKEVIAIVASGAFEEEPGEMISFYYYDDGGLTDISLRQAGVPVDKNWIDEVFSGMPAFKTIYLNESEPLRVYAISYFPNKTRIRLDKFKMGRRPPPRVKKNRFDRLPIPNQANIEAAVLVISRSAKDVEGVLQRLLQILLIALPITLLLSGWGGIFLLKRILNPIDQMTETARNIGGTDLTKRIPVETNDELGNLGVTLNMMIERLENAFRRQKELTSDASHELRAPLAVIQAEVSLSLQKQRDAQTYRSSLELVASETEHMSGIIKQILFLARSDAGKQILDFETVDLDIFLSNICDEMKILCDEEQHSLTYISNQKPSIQGNRGLLKNLFLNILTNAIRYTPAGGKIDVDLTMSQGQALIKISDTGIGIPKADLPHIYKRFYRVDKARSRQSGGCGLGLSISRQIAIAHKGSLDVESILGRGTVFIVKIPLFLKSNGYL